MSEFAPVSTVAEVSLLDDEEMAAGYWSGYNGAPEPVASVYSRAYMHGWGNGAVDAGLREKSPAQALMAHAFCLGASCTDRMSAEAYPSLSIQ